jgi:hypothetical protein
MAAARRVLRPLRRRLRYCFRISKNFAKPHETMVPAEAAAAIGLTA